MRRTEGGALSNWGDVVEERRTEREEEARRVREGEWVEMVPRLLTPVILSKN